MFGINQFFRRAIEPYPYIGTLEQSIYGLSFGKRSRKVTPSDVNELFIVINKKAEYFASGELKLKVSGRDIPLPDFWHTNNLTSIKGLFARSSMLYSLFGISYLYAPKTGNSADSTGIIKLLDNNKLHIEYNNKSELELNSFVDGIKKIDYTSRNKKVAVNPVDVIPIADEVIGNSLDPQSRLDSLKQKIENIGLGEKALGTTLQRAGMHLLTKELPPPSQYFAGVGAGTNVRSPLDDAQAKKQQDKFHEQNTILEKDLIILNKPFKVQSLQYDAGQLKTFEVKDEAFKKICYTFAVQHELFDSRTTFDNQKQVKLSFMDTTIKKEASIYADQLNQYFGYTGDDGYYFDYSESLLLQDNDLEMETE